MRVVISVLACAALVLVFALPGLFALECPVDATKLEYFPSKVVYFPHEAHQSLECQECHHKWDGEAVIKPCGESGCHDVLDKKDKSEKSLYKIIHGRGSKEISSCLSCHRDAASSDKELRKALTGCLGSKCHPK